MSSYQTVEYYQACPSCGAVNTGKDRCEYCGSSLIKSTVHKEIPSNVSEQEYANELEDAALPIIHGKNSGKNVFLVLFCSVFGGVFFFVSTILFVSFVSSGNMGTWLYFFFAAFWMIGIGALIPLFLYLIRRSKCKHGTEMTGIVRGYEENPALLINGRPVLRVKILVNQESNPSILVLSTGDGIRRYAIGQRLQIRNYNDNYRIME